MRRNMREQYCFYVHQDMNIDMNIETMKMYEYLSYMLSEHITADLIFIFKNLD